MSLSHTDRKHPSVNINGLTDGMLRIKKKGGSLMWRLLQVFFTDKITERFKMSALYGNETGSSMKMPTESPRDSKWQLRTMTCPIYRQIIRWNHRWNIPSVNPSAKVYTSTLTRPYSPLFLLLLLLLLPHLNSPQLQTTSPPPKKISIFWAQQVIYLEVFLSQHSCSDLPTDFYQFL